MNALNRYSCSYGYLYRVMTFLALMALACCSTEQHEPSVDEPGAAEPIPPIPRDDRPGDVREETPRSCPKAPSLDAELPVWDLYVTQEHWAVLHEDVFADVTVDALLCIDGKPHAIGLELQGSSTRDEAKKSFDLKLQKGKSLTTDIFGMREELPRVLLKAMFQDQSLIREAVSFDMWRAMGHDAPRLSFTNVRVNHADWGLYTVVEPVDEDYFARREALYPQGGRLFKGVRKHGSRADFAPGRDLRKAFENKADDEPQNYEDLKALVHTLQSTPIDQRAYEEAIDPIFALDAYLERMIWVSMTQNGDAVAQNFFLYNAPRDGRDDWRVVPWDSNIALGAAWDDRYGVRATSADLLVDGGNYFSRRLVQIDGLREQYIARFRKVMDAVLTQSVMLGILERHAARVEQDLTRDQARWKRKVAPRAAFDVIESFLRARPGYLDEALEELNIEVDVVAR